jgi:hypothetical protein
MEQATEALVHGTSQEDGAILSPYRVPCARVAGESYEENGNAGESRPQYVMFALGTFPDY